MTIALELMLRRLERLIRQADELLFLDEPGLNEIPAPDEPPEGLMDLEDDE